VLGETAEAPVPFAEGWYGFSWSPDGGAIFAAVIEGVEKGFNVWRVPVRAGEPGRIRRLPRGLCQRPRASPDGKWVVFYDAISHQLFRVRPDGTRLTRLTDGGDAYRLGFDWSSNAKQIYFSRGYQRRDKFCGIWRMNPDGTRKASVLDNYFARGLAVSPSGKYIAFNLATDAAGYDLFIYRVGDEKPALLAPQAHLFFSWHPRSDVLLYAHGQTLYEWRPATGSSRKPVFGQVRFPVATPDGKTILFLKKEGKSTFLWKLDVASGRTGRLFPPPARP